MMKKFQNHWGCNTHTHGYLIKNHKYSEEISNFEKIKFYKNEYDSGITLIALVITIIVLFRDIIITMAMVLLN